MVSIIRFIYVIFLLLIANIKPLLVANDLSPDELRAFNKKINKYHKGLVVRPVKGTTFKAGPNNTVFVTSDFVNDREHSLYHEIGHIKHGHLKKGPQFVKENDYLKIVRTYGDDKGPQIWGINNASYKREQEREADEAIPSSPDLLLKAKNFFYDMHATGKHNHRIGEGQSRIFESHPLPLERAQRFNDRYKKLLVGHFVTDENERLALNIPLVISGTSPKKAAAILGLDQDYYLSLSKDAKQFKKINDQELTTFKKEHATTSLMVDVPDKAKKVLGLSESTHTDGWFSNLVKRFTSALSYYFR